MKSKATASEHDVQKSILNWLELKDFFPIRINSQATISTYKGKTRMFRSVSRDGVSDIIGIVPQGFDIEGGGIPRGTRTSSVGSFLAIEVKDPSWKVPQPIRTKRTGERVVNPDFERWTKQRQFLDEVEKRGGIAILAKSLDDVIKVLEPGVPFLPAALDR